MIHHGVVQMARHYAMQHGAGRSMVSFWRDSLHAYNKSGKVKLKFESITFNLQWKYRIRAHRKIALAFGVHGKRMQTNSIYNGFFNDQGTVDGCKAGDLKVREQESRNKSRSRSRSRSRSIRAGA